jgi:phenylpropionate dioxygenase-like ring-hydroxylating dioxygenase large terminal subunit
MLTKEMNEAICRTDPGTPGGNLLRRYWHPVGLSTDVTPGGKPKQLRVMGEDLVLFRDDRGRPGLVGLHCSHRLTSLAFGRVEDGGIRCPFHGWLYDLEGHCLEQPAEPEGSTFKDRVRHPSYPCQELGGFIFAYMGPPECKPLLPPYEVLARQDGTRTVSCYPISCNYLQALEGVVDTIHFPFLHSDHWTRAKHAMAAMPAPRVELRDADYGIWQKATHAIMPLGKQVSTYSYVILPTMFLRIQPIADHEGTVEELQSFHTRAYRKYQSWYTPIDDTHCMRFQVGFSPPGQDGQPYVWPAEKEFVAPGPWNDYNRNYGEVDTVSGIPWDGPGTGVRDYLAQDSMANETQGPIVDRSSELLGAHDRVLVMTRQLLLDGIEAISQGRDPKHILRQPTPGGVLYIRGTEPAELG